jgi:hypothetical protein
MSNTTTPAISADQQVLGVLRVRLGAARLPELAEATGLSELEVLDALYELKRAGQVTPTVWRLTDQAGEG